VNQSSEARGSLSVENGRWGLRGVLTIDSAGKVLAASSVAPLPSSGIASLGGLERVDSAAVAVLLAWKRRAMEEGTLLVFADVPSSLTALAQLYGVGQLISPEAEGSRTPAA